MSTIFILIFGSFELVANFHSLHLQVGFDVAFEFVPLGFVEFRSGVDDKAGSSRHVLVLLVRAA